MAIVDQIVVGAVAIAAVEHELKVERHIGIGQEQGDVKFWQRLAQRDGIDFVARATDADHVAANRVVTRIGLWERPDAWRQKIDLI